MLDMGWTEILVIGVVALIVVGPKDLPRMLRTLGQYTGKLRGMARDFQRSMDDAAREADLEELKGVKDALSDVRAIKNDATRAITTGLNKIEGDIERQVEKETELDAGMLDETFSDADLPDLPEPSKTAPAEPTPAEPERNFVNTSAPVDKPDPGAGQATTSVPEPASAQKSSASGG